ncbi:MAG: hypothetical protein PVF87_02105 [Acidimicrobiia bacterium]
MKSESGIWLATGALVLAFGALIGMGASGVTVLLVALIGLFISYFVGSWMARPADASWIAKWVVLGFLAKLAGTAARYYMVTVIYESGDSYRYYRVGAELAAQWRNGDIPPLTGSGSFGTQVTEAFTGGLFAFITPDFLGGFLLFAIFAYLGQILLYAAFRRHARPNQLKPYAFMIFFLPTYAFWPSSIGKDALVLLALGGCAYSVSRALEAFQVRWLFTLGISLAAVGLIRIHIAGLVVGAFALSALIARIPSRDRGGVFFRRVLTLSAGVAAAVLVISLFPDLFGVDVLNTQARDDFTADLVRRTSEEEIVNSDYAVSTPLDVPNALSHVLFRPYVFEASELQQYLAAAETSLVLLLALWRLPTILKNLGKWRSNPYVVFSTFYTLGFAVAFSVVQNLGIIARQRGQVFAFFMAIIIGLGWPAEEEEGVNPSSKPSAALTG